MNTTSDILAQIETRLAATLDIQKLSIEDFSHLHRHHSGHAGGVHVSALIVSGNFAGLSLVERHKLIYQILGNMIKKDIHAISMETLTPEEWSEKKIRNSQD